MSTKYVLKVQNIETVDAEEITDLANSAAGKYKFKQAAEIQTEKKMGFTKTIYHSKTNAFVNTTGKIIPIWQLQNQSEVTIGKIFLNITFGTAEDNIAKTQLLRLVTTSITDDNDSGVTSTLETSADSDLTAITAIGTNINNSNFYIKGRTIVADDITKKFTHIIDLNTTLLKKNENTRYSVIALNVNETPAGTGTIIKLDSYVEIIS